MKISVYLYKKAEKIIEKLFNFSKHFYRVFIFGSTYYLSLSIRILK